MDGPCLTCGRPADSGATFCGDCVGGIGPVVVIDDPFGRPDAAGTPRGRSASGPPRWLGGLGAAVALAIGATALLVPGTSLEGPEASPVVELPTPTPFTPIPTPIGFRGVIEPDASTTTSGRAAAVRSLPPMTATHVAVARGQDLAFLDLRSGAWTLHERVARPISSQREPLVPFADGVLTTGTRGESTFSTPDEPARQLDAGELLGVHGDLAFVRGYRGSNQMIAAVDAAGEVRASLDLPPVTVAREVTTDGAVLVEGPDGSYLWSGEPGADLAAVDTSDDPPTVRSWLAGVRGTDASGTHVRVDGDRLLFHGPTGDPITEVSLTILGDRGAYALALLTVP